MKDFEYLIENELYNLSKRMPYNKGKFIALSCPYKKKKLERYHAGNVEAY